MSEEPPSVFKDVFRAAALRRGFKLQMIRENDAPNAKAAFHASQGAYVAVVTDIKKLKYWFIQSLFDMDWALRIMRKHSGYDGVVIVKDHRYNGFHPVGVAAITQKEAEDMYGVEDVAEAEKEAEALNKKLQDKLEKWKEEITKKLKEAEAQPEAIRKKLEKAEAEVEALTKKLKEAEEADKLKGAISKKRKKRKL